MEIPQKVDIIVSEWMGFYLVHESMLSSVLNARDRFLKPEGVMIPTTATIWCAPAQLTQFHQEHIEYWNNLYGFDFSPVIPYARTAATHTASTMVVTVLPDDLLSKPEQVAVIDMKNDALNDVSFFWNACTFDINKTGTMRGVALWFDVTFPSTLPPTTLSTSPMCPPTHWKQTVVHFPTDFAVQSGQKASFSVSITSDETNKRLYNISIEAMADDQEPGANDADEGMPDHPQGCDCLPCALVRAFLRGQTEDS